MKTNTWPTRLLLLSMYIQLVKPRYDLARAEVDCIVSGLGIVDTIYCCEINENWKFSSYYATNMCWIETTLCADCTGITPNNFYDPCLMSDPSCGTPFNCDDHIVTSGNTLDATYS